MAGKINSYVVWWCFDTVWCLTFCGECRCGCAAFCTIFDDDNDNCYCYNYITKILIDLKSLLATSTDEYVLLISSSLSKPVVNKSIPSIGNGSVQIPKSILRSSVIRIGISRRVLCDTPSILRGIYFI